MLKTKLFFVVFGVFLSSSLFANGDYEPYVGDLIFQSLPSSDLVDAIEGATKSPYSHVGIVLKSEKGWMVREAIGDVHDTKLTEFLSRGRNFKFDVYRFKAKYQPLIPKIIAETANYLGRPYDIRYRMDDSAIYCSELIYKAAKDATGLKLGNLVKLGSLDWGPYQSLIISIEGGPVPKERVMITPRDLAKATQLELVYSAY